MGNKIQNTDANYALANDGTKLPAARVAKYNHLLATGVIKPKGAKEQGGTPDNQGNQVDEKQEKISFLNGMTVKQLQELAETKGKADLVKGLNKADLVDALLEDVKFEDGKVSIIETKTPAEETPESTTGTALELGSDDEAEKVAEAQKAAEQEAKEEIPAALNEAYDKFLKENSIDLSKANDIDIVKIKREFAQSLEIENFDTIEMEELDKLVIAKFTKAE